MPMAVCGHTHVNTDAFVLLHLPAHMHTMYFPNTKHLERCVQPFTGMLGYSPVAPRVQKNAYFQLLDIGMHEACKSPVQTVGQWKLFNFLLNSTCLCRLLQVIAKVMMY